MKPRSTIVLLVLCCAATRAARADVYQVKPPVQIQTAVALALANDDPDDLVFVAPGTYEAPVVVDFTGTSQQSLKIVRSTSVRPVLTGGLVIRSARLVALLGLVVGSLQGDGAAGILITDSTGVTITQCVGVAGDDGGLDVTGSSGVEVRESFFDFMKKTAPGTGFGIRITGGCAHVVRGTELVGNEGSALVVAASQSTVKHCEVQANGGGITVDGLANAVVQCEVRANGGDGIVVRGSGTARKNDVRANTGAGLRFGAGGIPPFQGSAALDNVVRDNQGPGILLREDQHGGVVTGNQVIGNRGAGILVHGEGHRVADNKCKGTGAAAEGGHGILLAAASRGHCVGKNVLSSNAGEGIRVEGDDNLLVENHAKGNDGIVRAGSTIGNAGHANTTISGTNHFP